MDQSAAHCFCVVHSTCTWLERRILLERVEPIVHETRCRVAHDLSSPPLHQAFPLHLGDGAHYSRHEATVSGLKVHDQQQHIVVAARFLPGIPTTNSDG